MSSSRIVERWTSRILAACVVTIAVANAPVDAHEFWVHLPQHRVATGDKIAVALMVGEKFQGDLVGRQADRIVRLVAANTKDVLEIPGEEGSALAGQLALPEPGMWTVAYESKPKGLFLRASDFEDYLKHEGLEYMIEKRARLGESERVGFETFTRCAKALVQVGDTSVGFDRVMGLPLELVARDDPRAIPAEGMRVELRYGGKPLPKAMVRAVSRRDREKVLELRTDEEGIVRLPLKDSGPWLVSAVHMVRAGEEVREDWQSYWASLVFEARPPTPKAD